MIGTPPGDMQETVAASNEYWEGHAPEKRRNQLANNLAQVDPKGLAAMEPGDLVISTYVTNGPK